EQVVVIVLRNFVIVLGGEVQSGHRIPGQAHDVFLTKKIGVFIFLHYFLLPHVLLVLEDVTSLLFPLAFSVKEPVLDSGIAQIESFGEAIVVRRSFAHDWLRRAEMEAARRIRWVKGRRICYRFFGQEHIIVVLTLMRVAEAANYRKVFEWHPE